MTRLVWIPLCSQVDETGPGAPVGTPITRELQQVRPGQSAQTVQPNRFGAFEAVLLGLAACVLAILWRLDVVRAGSFARMRPAQRTARDLEFGQWAVAGFAVMLTGTIATLMVILIFGPAVADQKVELGLPLQVLATLTGQATVALVGGWALLRLPRILGGKQAALEQDGTAFAGTAGYGKSIVWGVAGFLLAAPVVWATGALSVLIANWLSGPSDPLAHSLLKTISEQRTNPWVWGLMTGAAVGAPIAEEILYRGFFQSALLRLTGRVWVAIVLTSCGFVLMHWSAVPPRAMPTLFVLSLAMGMARERTGGLMAPIVIHSLFNTANLLLASAGPD